MELPLDDEESQKQYLAPSHCCHCGRPETSDATLSECGTCGIGARYCSAECVRLDFDRHKDSCNQRAAAMLCRAIRRMGENGGDVACDEEIEKCIMNEIRRLARHKRVINTQIENYRPVGGYVAGNDNNNYSNNNISSGNASATTAPGRTVSYFGGWTALHECVRLNNLNILDLLLRSGAQVNLANANHQTPLWLASSSLETRLEILKRLLEEPSVDPNSVASDGSTPLVRATLVGSRRRVELLLERGASVNVGVDDSGRTVLEIAKANAAFRSPQVHLMDSPSGTEVQRCSTAKQQDEATGHDENDDDSEAKKILNLVQTQAFSKAAGGTKRGT